MTEKTKVYSMNDKQKLLLAKQFDDVCAQLRKSGADLSKIKIIPEMTDQSIKLGLIDSKRLKEGGCR